MQVITRLREFTGRYIKSHAGPPHRVADILTRIFSNGLETSFKRICRCGEIDYVEDVWLQVAQIADQNETDSS